MSRKRKNTSSPTPTIDAQAAALERFRLLLAPEDFQALLAELGKPLLPALRSNPLKAAPGDQVLWAERYGWKLKPVPYCSSGWWVTENAGPLSQTLEHRMGHYYLQDAASMLPAELFDLDPAEEPLILDLAASPGGKTTHLVARSLDRGLVIANDSASERISALRSVLQTWGAANVAVTRFPAEKFGAWFPETFDRILLDAPCSMQSLRSTDAHPMRAISPREQNTLARRQAAMLASALAALKPGGQIVYSTCTLAPEEDEAVLNAILERFPGVVEVLPLDERLPLPAPALAEAPGEIFDPQIRRAARLWPQRYGTSGFFAALIRKTGSVPVSVERPPARPLTAVGQEPLPRKERLDLLAFFNSIYGFDLGEVLEDLKLELWRSPGSIFAVPRRYLDRFGDLPCQLLGLKLAESTPQGPIPSHEWVARFGPRFEAGWLTLPGEEIDNWLGGKDAPADFARQGESGDVVLVRDPDGRILGRGRVQAGRLRNLLPRRLF
jgi:16S rRNA (cytosine1407-C5)-methyltransferase